MNYYAKGRKAIKLRTVNVMEFANDTLQQVQAFADNAEGNKRAEKLFKRLVTEYEKPCAEKSDAEDFENYLDDGVYDVFPGYQVFITHAL